MAREFAQIKLAIWADDDWRDLSPDARYLYLTLLTSPTLTHCGTADWRPARLSALNGQRRETIEDAGAELVHSLHLVIDEETEEVLIRSFIRNDGLMKQPRMAVSMANAHAAVASRTLRGVVVHELRRLRADFPELSGWEKEKATHILSLEAVDPSDYPLGGDDFRGPFTPGLAQTQGSISGSVKGSPTPAPTPATSTSRRTPSPSHADADDVPDGFDHFWEIYDKKVGRKAAEQKYRIALKKPGVTPTLLIEAAVQYVAWQKSEAKHPEFTKNAATWLNGEHWNDERVARAEPRGRVREHLDLVQRLRAKEEAEAQQQPHLRQIGPS